MAAFHWSFQFPASFLPKVELCSAVLIRTTTASECSIDSVAETHHPRKCSPTSLANSVHALFVSRDALISRRRWQGKGRKPMRDGFRFSDSSSLIVAIHNSAIRCFDGDANSILSEEARARA